MPLKYLDTVTRICLADTTGKGQEMPSTEKDTRLCHDCAIWGTSGDHEEVGLIK